MCGVLMCVAVRGVGENVDRCGCFLRRAQRGSKRPRL
jgi:hypothetical protein